MTASHDRRSAPIDRNGPPATATTTEPRWPVALAVSSFIAMTIVLRVAQPHRETIGPAWLVPGLEFALLAALVAADPARIAQRRPWLRPIAIVLVVALLL